MPELGFGAKENRTYGLNAGRCRKLAAGTYRYTQNQATVPLTTNPSMTKRPHSPQGELLQRPVKSKISDHTMSQIDDQTVFSQLEMPVPDNALVEDTTIADNTTLDKRVRETLRGETDDRRFLLKDLEDYRVNHNRCSQAVHAFSSVPAIFKDNQDSQDNRVSSYKDTIKHNPWLVKMLVDAHTKEMYGNIRRIGLLRQSDNLSAANNPSC